MTAEGTPPPPLTALDVDPSERDVNMTDLTIATYTRYENNFLVTLTGTAHDEESHESEDDILSYTVTLTFGYYSTAYTERAERLANAVETVVERWSEESTSLTLWGAPGLFYILIDEDAIYLPIPRG